MNIQTVRTTRQLHFAVMELKKQGYSNSQISEAINNNGILNRSGRPYGVDAVCRMTAKPPTLNGKTYKLKRFRQNNDTSKNQTKISLIRDLAKSSIDNQSFERVVKLLETM